MPRLKTYETLYIYCIDGLTPGAEDHFGAELLASWEDGGATLLFFETPHEPQVIDYLETLPAAGYNSETVLDYANWESGYRVEATRVAGFLICPTWDVREPGPGETRILLDPGVAFGTGLHPSTRCSLTFMRSVFEQSAPGRVLDLGCGTGILSIAAIKSGAERCAAVDYAPMAIKNTAANLELNGVADRVDIICGSALDFTAAPADLITCNIYIQVIEKLLADPRFTAHDWIIMSGIIGEDQHLKMLKLIRNSALEHVETIEERNWFTYLTRGNPGEQRVSL